MAAIAMLHHMPTSQAVEHATALVCGSSNVPLPSALILLDIALHDVLCTSMQNGPQGTICTQPLTL